MKTYREVAQNMGSTDPISAWPLWNMLSWPDIHNEFSLRELIERGTAPKYYFIFEEFAVNNPRAMFTDTDYVNFALKIGDKMFPTQNKFIGDASGGNIYEVGLTFGPITIEDPDTTITFNYQILNNGHDDQAKVMAALDASAKALALTSFAVGLAITSAGVILKIISAAYSNLVSFIGLFSESCDGIVAADQIETTERELKGATSENGKYSETRHYPGTNSPTFSCDGNSSYFVKWSITRIW